MTAKIVTVFNQKGGCGKTTVSMHIAGTIGLRRNKRVLLIDMDEQGTATRWYSQASDEHPFPATVVNCAAMGGRMHQAVRSHIDDYDLIVIDCPPAITSPVPSSALVISDLALIPVKPTPGDSWSAETPKRLLEMAKAQNTSLMAMYVLNEYKPDTRMANAVIEALAEDEDIPMAKASFIARTAYQECYLLGQTVHGVAGARKAVAEADALAAEVAKLIKLK